MSGLDSINTLLGPLLEIKDTPDKPDKPDNQDVTLSIAESPIRGKNAANNGKIFEKKTSNDIYLLQHNFQKKKFISASNDKKQYYLKYSSSSDASDKKYTIIYTNQHGFLTYVRNKFKIHPIRVPDEAYIIKKIQNGNPTYIIKILEKKYQTVNGSVETKLWAGPSLKFEYETIFGPDYEIQYAFTVNDFIKKKLINGASEQKTNEVRKYNILSKILKNNDIPIFYGDDSDYLTKLNSWIFDSTLNV